MKRFTRKDILLLPFEKYLKTGLTVALQLLVGGTIPTLEGEKKAYKGDYLCIGVAGEIWPVRKAHFEAEKQIVAQINEHIAVYRSTGVRHACRIDEQFFIEKDNGDVAFVSADDGDYLVWNGRPEPQEFKAWIVEKSIFEASYERCEETK